MAYALISQAISQSIAGFVAQVDAALVTVGPIGLQDALLTRRQGKGRGRPKLDLTLSYTTSGPLNMRAAYFTGAYGQDVDTQAAAFFAALPNARVHFIRDVGDDERGSLNSNAIMVIYSESVLPNCAYNRSRVVIVEATENIAAGATGDAQLVDASGLVVGETIQVVNRFDSQWDTGTRGYAVLRNGTCLWDGFQTCC